MFFLLGILSSLAVWQFAFALNCSLIQEEFRNGNRNSSTGYRLGSHDINTVIGYDYLRNNEYYIPQCTAGDLFEKIQCTSLNQSVPTTSRNPSIQCWCVDPVTGISVDYYTEYRLKNASECDNTTNVNTTALCGQGQYKFTFIPDACYFHACVIGPPHFLAFTGECDYLDCPEYQTIVYRPIPHGCGCENYACSDPLIVASLAIGVALVLVVIVIIIAVVVICCGVCKKSKVTQSAHPVVANNVHFSIPDEKVDIPGDNDAYSYSVNSP